MLTTSEREELSDILWQIRTDESGTWQRAVYLLSNRIDELEYNLSKHGHTEVVKF